MAIKTYSLGLFLIVSLFIFSGCDDSYNSGSASTSSSVYDGCENEKDELEDQISELESDLEDYKTALSEANDRIRDANYYAWSSYEEMGDALDDLNEVLEP